MESGRTDPSVSTAPVPACPIVGVGASAGGLDAFQRLLAAVPKTTSHAFVLVQHLDSSRKSVLDELIQASSHLPVVRAKDKMLVVAGHVYVAPEGKVVALVDGRIRLSRKADDCHSPIDSFFLSLAAHSHGFACAVLLSGNGDDGVQGLREIAAAGGLTFAQEPTTAFQPAMPTAAIAADVADFVGSPEEIGARFADATFAERVDRLAGSEESDEEEAALAAIVTLLRREHGMDFSRYKPATVRRRIGRRAMLLNTAGYAGYFEVLRDDPHELDTLFGDMLINVTQFFRDPEVFDELKSRVVPQVIESKHAGDAVRVWVPGCSTGEEVYSVLMTVLEAVEIAGVALNVTVFGTDASEDVLRTAREALYPETICGVVSKERLARFFTRTDKGYRVKRELRELCVFARHDITADTPFSRLDLITMRNLLIYLDQESQRRVLAVAHFALRPDGILVLGTSESPDSRTGLFDVVDKSHHIFSRRDVAPKLPLDVASAGRLATDAMSISLGLFSPDTIEYDAQAESDRLSLSLYAPPRVLVDENRHVLHFFGDTSPFLEHPEGRATLDLLEIARSGLALDVEEALDAAGNDGGPAYRETTFVAPDGRRLGLSVEVVPLDASQSRTHSLVAFREVPVELTEQIVASGHEDLVRVYDDRERRLRRELSAQRGRLRALAEEKELANQSLSSANEEIRSANEELQSINEELETAKEELQSSNEELMTVNDELGQRNSQLISVNDDIVNFIDSADIPVVMVDGDLNVRRFTPQAELLFGVAQADIGRPLQRLSLRFGGSGLVEVVARIAAGADDTCEQEIQDDQGRWYLVRARPYQGSDGGAAAGVVVAAIDIDDIKSSARRIERGARLSEALNEIDAHIASALDPSIILQWALDEGVGALGADAGTIELRDGVEWVVRHENGIGADEVGKRLTDTEAPIAARVASGRTPVMITDIAGEAELNAGFVRSLGLKSVLAVPLIVREQVTGCLMFFTRHQGKAFTKTEVDFGARLGASVSLALENARLFAAERRSARLTESLNRINEILMSALTTQDVLARLVDEVSEVAGADKSLVIEVTCETLTVTHVRNVRDDIVGQPKDAAFFPGFALAANERRPILVEDNWSDPRTNKDFVVPYELRSFQLMPLIVDDVVVAVLAFAFDEPRTFDAHDLRFSERMSTAMSLALRNARLFEAERGAQLQARRELEITGLLLEASESFSLRLDMEAVFDALARSATRLTGRSGIFINLYDETTRTMTIMRSARGTSAVGTKLHLETLAPDLVRSLEEQRALVLDYTDPELPDEYKRDARKHNVTRLLSVPLVAGDRVVGMVFIDESGEDRPFTAREIEVMQGLAPQAALAIQNARLHDEIREASERTAGIIESIADGFYALDRDWRYVYLNTEMGRMIGKQPDELLGKTVAQVFDEDVAAEFRDVYGPAMNEGRAVSRERLLSTGLWVETHAYPSSQGISIYTRDITKRKHAEALMQRHAAFLKGVARVFEAGLSARSEEELGEACLAVAEEVTESKFGFIGEIGADGLLHDVAMSDPGWELCTMHDKSGHRRPPGDFELHGLYGQVLLDGESLCTNTPSEHPQSIGTPEGHPALEAFLGVPLIRDGKTIGMIAVGNREDGYGSEEVDTLEALAVTIVEAFERKRAERALRESREDLNRAQSVAQIGSWRLDTRSNALLWSDETYRMFGVPAGTPLTYELFLSGIHPQDREYVDERWTAATQGEPYDIEHRILVDGDVRWVREQAEMDFDEKGELLGGFGTVQDITDSKRAAAQREQYLFRLVRLLDASTRVLASSSTHDMLQGIANAARELIGARLVVSGHGRLDGTSWVGVTSKSDDAPPCIEGDVFARERVSAYQGLIEGVDSVRLTAEELRQDPNCESLPKVHVPLVGLLGVPLCGSEGATTGLIMLSDKIDGDFTHEDELLLRQLASIASLGLQQIEAKEEIADERSRLRTIIDTIPTGFSLLAPDGSVIENNAAIDGIWAGEAPGSPGSAGYSARRGFHRDTGAPVLPEEWPALRVVATGEFAEEVVDIERLDGTRGSVRVAAFPIRDEEDKVSNIVVVTEDVSEAVEREELDEAISLIRSEITATLDLDEVLQVLTEMGAAAFGAQSASIVMNEGDRWIVREATGRFEPSMGMVFGTDDMPFVSKATQQRRPTIVHGEDDSLANSEIMRRFGFESVLALPLISRGRVIGVASFDRHAGAAPFTSAHLDFAARLVNVTGLALDNAAAYERERTIADTLQEAIMTPPEEIAGLEQAYLYRSASEASNVGGDLFDVFEISPDVIGLLIGDVSGKGIEAARMTSLVRDGIRAYAYDKAEPGWVLGHLNELVFRSSPGGMFATLFFGVLDLLSGTLRHASGGHPPPMIIGDDGARQLETTGCIVGAFEGIEFSAGATRLEPGETLVMFTDGLTEARRDGELLGQEGVATALNALRTLPLAELPERLVDAALAFSHGPLKDDTVILCVKRPRLASEPVVEKHDA